MSGKPKKIDESLLKWMAVRQCTQAEMAEALGCDPSTLKRRFAPEMAKWRSVGKTRLRAMQWKRAKKGSDSMLIHLGKNILDQSDRYKVETSGEPFDPLAAYADNPELLARAQQLEIDGDAATRKAVAPLDAGETDVPGVDVPASHPEAGSVRDADADRPDVQPGDCGDPGEDGEERLL